MLYRWNKLDQVFLGSFFYHSLNKASFFCCLDDLWGLGKFTDTWKGQKEMLTTGAMLVSQLQFSNSFQKKISSNVHNDLWSHRQKKNPGVENPSVNRNRRKRFRNIYASRRF